MQVVAVCERDDRRRAAAASGAVAYRDVEPFLEHEMDAVILWPTPPSRSLYLRHGFAFREDLMERRRDSQAR